MQAEECALFAQNARTMGIRDYVFWKLLLNRSRQSCNGKLLQVQLSKMAARSVPRVFERSNFHFSLLTSE